MTGDNDVAKTGNESLRQRWRGSWSSSMLGMIVIGMGVHRDERQWRCGQVLVIVSALRVLTRHAHQRWQCHQPCHWSEGGGSSMHGWPSMSRVVDLMGEEKVERADVITYLTM